MSISQADAELLYQAGFTPSEINMLAEAKTSKGDDQPPINLDSPVWRATLHTRKEWVLDKLDRGWTNDEIRNELGAYYRRDESRTPFDFLRAEYKPPKKVDYIEILRKQTQAQIIGEIEGYKFGRRR